MRHPRLFGMLLLALCFLVGQAGPAMAQQPLTVRLEPVAGSGVRGTATATAVEGRANLVLEVTGLAPGATVNATIRSGTCEQPSASSGVLGTLAADTSGRATLTTTQARVSAAGVPTDLSLDLVAQGNIAIPGLACGNGPAAAAEAPATRLPATGGPAPLALAAVLGALGLLAFRGGLRLRN